MRRLSLILSLLLILAGGLSATRPATQEACQHLLGQWETKLHKDGFSSCMTPPFVLAGDLSQSDLEAWRDQTVRPAAEALARTYFKTPPDEPVMIMLFATEKSYREHAKAWFGDTDVSHFGYFRRDGVMLMNISTGGGTLVHEMVHALLRPDFPDCPDWVNEGMGSLYEQCTLQPLKGLTNWRLEGLQEAIREKRLRSLQELIEDTEFYRKDTVGVNYAQARYLLMYLQEKGLLQQFYTRLREGQAHDANGLKTLRAVIGEDLAAFEPQWREWVMRLHFP